MSPVVYNQVWEDYEVDRVALGVNAEDVLLMITSGGCNVLNTLAEEPRRIVTIDANPWQHELLDTKISLIKGGDHESLWRTFGAPAQQSPRSVYARGSYARFAWVRAFIRLVCGRAAIRRLVESETLDEQRWIYEYEIEPRLFGLAVRAMPAALAGICGMHWRQVATTLRPGRFLLPSVCMDRLRHVLTSFPIRDNYFWHQMLTGAYAGRTQCPPYLHAERFDHLRTLADRVESHVGDVAALMRATPAATFTKVNLLDVPDFLSPQRKMTLFREVRRVCAPGARVIYRSFAPHSPVPAEYNGDSPGGLRHLRDLSAQLSVAERTASYGAVHVYDA